MAGHPPTEGAAPATGEIIGGRYRLTKLLGSGGMGEVYAADHIHITKRVAIKLLHPEISANPEALKRFKQEAQSSSSIGHDNIVRIDDFFALEDGRVCMCMEYLEGRSLAELIHAPGGIEPLRAIELIGQVCDGLEAAHAKGIVHRDMKPENIFVTMARDGSECAKILDFGIAKVTSPEGDNLTKTGTVFGTPNYMSPEQALGHHVDARADVYSVGVILFELFTGDVPFKAESFMGVLSQHITKPPPVPSSVTPGRLVPQPIEEIIIRALAKDPSARFGSVRELKDALWSVAGALGGDGAGLPRFASTRIGVPSPLPAGEAKAPTMAAVANAAESAAATAPPEAAQRRVPPTIVAGRGPLADEARPQPSADPGDRGPAPGAPKVGTPDNSAGAGVTGPAKGGRAAVYVTVTAVIIALLAAGGFFLLRRGDVKERRRRPHAVERTVSAGAATAIAEQLEPDLGTIDAAGTLDAAPVDPDAAPLVALATKRRPRRSSGGAPPATVAAAAAGADAGVVPSQRTAPRSHATQEPAKAPVRERYAVHLVSVPADAAVFVDGRRLESRTPITLQLRPGERVAVKLAKGGWRDHKLNVVGQQRDQTLRITLRRQSFGGASVNSGGGIDGDEDLE